MNAAAAAAVVMQLIFYFLFIFLHLTGVWCMWGDPKIIGFTFFK